MSGPKQTLQEKLRIAADILEKGLPWQGRYSDINYALDDPGWIDRTDSVEMTLRDPNYEIRIKPCAKEAS